MVEYDSYDITPTSLEVRNKGAQGRSGNFTIRKASSKDQQFSFTIRKAGNATIREALIARNAGSAGLLTNFWVNGGVSTYTVDRITSFVTQKTATSPSIATTDVYQTLLEQEVIGYSSFSVIIAAGAPNDITYRIQASVVDRPSVWADVPDQVDVDVLASDPESMGIVANFAGQFEVVRIQVRNRVIGQSSRAWASMKGSTAGDSTPEAFSKPKMKAWSGTKLTSVDTYVTVPDAILATDYFNVRGYRSKTIQLSAATNNLLYSVDVSNDATVWVNKTTDQSLLTTTPKLQTLTELWDFIRVQVKPAVSATHGTITVKISGGTL
jgi:hypothetical protein